VDDTKHVPMVLTAQTFFWFCLTGRLFQSNFWLGQARQKVLKYELWWTTTAEFFTDRVRLLSPNQQRQALRR